MPDSRASIGDSVKVHFTGKVTGGEVFVSSEGKDPVEFELGAGRVLPGLEQAVVGMSPGEEKSVQLEAKDAYGEHRPEQVVEVERARLGGDVELEVGQALKLSTNDGREVRVTVAGFDDSKVKLDANHPMAGKDLTFDIKLISIAA